MPVFLIPEHWEQDKALGDGSRPDREQMAWHTHTEIREIWTHTACKDKHTDDTLREEWCICVCVYLDQRKHNVHTRTDKWYGCTQQKHNTCTEGLVCHGNTMWVMISKDLFYIKLQPLSLSSQVERLGHWKKDGKINRKRERLCPGEKHKQR